MRRITLGIFQCMGFHFLLRPVQRFTEPVCILKECIIPDRLGFLPLFLIFDQVDLYFLIQWIVIYKLPLFNRQDVQFFVISRPDSKLDISLITKLELGYFDTMLIVVKWDHIELTQLRAG